MPFYAGLVARGSTVLIKAEKSSSPRPSLTGAMTERIARAGCAMGPDAFQNAIVYNTAISASGGVMKKKSLRLVLKSTRKTIASAIVNPMYEARR